MYGPPGSWHLTERGADPGGAVAHTPLDILGVRYNLYITEGLVQLAGGGTGHGECNTTDCTISVADGKRTLACLLHEVFHELIFMGHLPFLKQDGDDCEQRIDHLSSLLAEVLQRNPNVFAELINKEKK